MKNPKKPFRIGLDIDGVIANWTATTANYFNTKYGYNFGPDDPPNWDYFEEHVTKKQWSNMWDSDDIIEIFRDTPLYPGAADFVKKLDQIGDVILITSRPAKTASTTYSWVLANNLPVAGINVVGSGKEKWQVICEVLIDDKPENVFSYVFNPIDTDLWQPYGLLFSRDYNKQLDAEHLRLSEDRYFKRVNGYDDVLENVSALYKQGKL